MASLVPQLAPRVAGHRHHCLQARSERCGAETGGHSREAVPRRGVARSRGPVLRPELANGAGQGVEPTLSRLGAGQGVEATLSRLGAGQGVETTLSRLGAGWEPAVRSQVLRRL